MVNLSSALSFVPLPRALAACAVALALASAPPPASADPVTFVFDVRIDYRCSPDGCEPFPAAFPLRVTVDSTIGSRIDKPWYQERWFGMPTFSAVPLARPEIAGGAPNLYTPAYYGGSLRDDGWSRVAHAYDGFEVVVGETRFNWNTSLYRTEDQLSVPPVLTAHGMAEFLGSSRGSGFFGFSFSGQRPGGLLTPDSVGYMGSATYVGQAPIPEPAGLVLAATGLLVLLRVRRA